MYTYICIDYWCTYVNICIHFHKHLHLYTYIYICIYITGTCTYSYSYTCRCARTCACRSSCTCTLTCTCTCTRLHMHRDAAMLVCRRSRRVNLSNITPTMGNTRKDSLSCWTGHIVGIVGSTLQLRLLTRRIDHASYKGRSLQPEVELRPGNCEFYLPTVGHKQSKARNRKPLCHRRIFHVS